MFPIHGRRLSQEIAHRIVDDVQEVDRPSLKSLSLASHVFLRRSQQHMFHSALVDTSDKCQRLYAAVTENPTLETHIKELQIGEDTKRNWVTKDEILPLLLGQMNHVENFMLNNFTIVPELEDDDQDDAMSGGGESDEDDEDSDDDGEGEVMLRRRWSELPKATTDAFMRMFALPTLRKLSICELKGIPTSIFNVIGDLELLTLLEVKFADVPGFNVNAVAARQASFDTLEVAIDSSCRQLDALIRHPESPFGRVSKMIVRVYDYAQRSNVETVSKIMRAARQSLRHVAWIDRCEGQFVPPIPPAIGAIQNLENLTFKFSLDRREPLQKSTTRFIKLVNALNDPDVTRNIRTLRIGIDGVDEPELIGLLADMPCWGSLDELLAPGETNVEVSLYSYKEEMEDEGDEVWEAVLGAKMPLLMGRGRLLAEVKYDEFENEHYFGD
ncbi:hypothetical protein Hypma_004534 [Hypsizygus marmoreus]|uniref:F-box domain-containing protein n=1 Tax=Hypsizygus marmoreus TaxID=39966 RepID=A0A369JY33_HYPMA|nr:hypothetical protein Hypma_004534 [Hypsizygus marmoreus]